MSIKVRLGFFCSVAIPHAFLLPSKASCYQAGNLPSKQSSGIAAKMTKLRAKSAENIIEAYLKWNHPDGISVANQVQIILYHW